MSNVNHTIKMADFIKRLETGELSVSPIDFCIEWYNAAKIEYSQTWENGTHYFDPATEISLTEPAWSIDPMGRKLIICPIVSGENVVLFERYSSDTKTIAFNLPHPRKARTGDTLRQCFPDNMRLGSPSSCLRALGIMHEVSNQYN